MLLEFSCTAGAGSYGVSDCVVVVSLELEEGRITTTGGLASVFVVTVLLLTLGAAGMVETVLSDSVVVWHHALPARPTAIHCLLNAVHRYATLIRYSCSQVAPITSIPIYSVSIDILSKVSAMASVVDTLCPPEHTWSGYCDRSSV